MRFLAVVEHGSLAAAAPDLRVTQQALGASIATLEREVGVVLLERGPGGQTAPTPYGELLIRHARTLIAGAARAREELLAFRDARGGSVTIGVGETFAPEIIAATISLFHNLRPDVKIVVLEDYTELLLKRMADGEIDFIAGADMALGAEAFIRFPLYAANDIVIARAEHPLAGRKSLTLKQLQPFTWMAPYSRPADASVIAETFLKAGLEPPSRFLWTDAVNVGAHLLRHGNFLFMTSPAMLAWVSPQEGGPIVKLNTSQPSVERRAGLIYSEGTRLNPAAMQLMEEIRVATHRHIGEVPYALPLNMDRRLSDAA
jgi:DNA-binding transcriptional LysR family regulator